MFYLTKLDDELTSSGGARDPLGLQSVWSYFGRRLVPSLTTVSTRSRHFSRLLLALYCRDYWLDVRPDTELRRAEPLLIFEELHAYSLRDQHETIGDTPGKLRVEANWRDLGKDPWIGHWPEQQLLRNQAGVGISGRYFTPLVRMGIVDKDGRLSADVDVGLLFGSEVEKLRKAVAKMLDAIESKGEPQAFSSFSKAARQLLTQLLPRDRHATNDEVEFWKERIGITGDRHHLVRRAAQHIRQISVDSPVPKMAVDLLLDDGEELTSTERQIVEDISTCEAFIAPLQKLFDELHRASTLPHFQGSTQTQRWLEQIKKARPAFAALDIEGTDLQRRFRTLTEIDVEGNVEDFATTLLRHHEEMVKARGGTPWIALEGARVHALNAGYEPGSWSDEERMDAWVHSYYLWSLASVLRDLEGKA